jgi:hypothetical protein
MLRIICGPKRIEVSTGWRKLNHGELHSVYSPPNIITMINKKTVGWARHIAQRYKEQEYTQGFVRKPYGKKPAGRPGRRWNHNIKMNLRETE